MKQDKLFRILGEIDEDLIVEAEAAKPMKSIHWKRYLSLAACAVLVIVIGVSMNQPKSTDNPSKVKIDPSLPLLAVEPALKGGQGYEGYIATSTDELVNENPWSEVKEDVSVLPVMNTTLELDESKQLPPVADEELMKTLLSETAENLGIETEIPEVQDYSVSVENQKYKVEVDSTLETTVYFQTDNQLPEEYNYTPYAPYDDVHVAAEYLQEKYREYIDMENPKINITGGDRTIDGDQNYQISFYDDSGDITQRILNYNFNYVTFACNEDGTLMLSKRYNRDLSDVIGEYPIINEGEAEKLLIEGNYITSVPVEFPGDKYVEKAELIYKNSIMEDIYMPYYRFYVELPTEIVEEGDFIGNNYGIYYVPAVEHQYIKEMPNN